MSVAIIPDLVKYQIEWLTSHKDLEFEPVIEDAIVKMLQDTGKSFIDEQHAETSQTDHIAESDRKVSISCAHENDLIFRQAAIDALARMMPRSYTPDGSHPADEEIFRAQEVFADCIEALEILPSAQPEQPTVKRRRGKWNAYYHGVYENPSFSYSCNQCGCSAPYGMYGGEYSQKQWTFCPNCGADMRKENES